MISLESLLGADTEIKHKISTRLALLLGLIGYDTLGVFENTKKFYDKRSKLLHGGITINDNPEITSKDIRSILKYSKDCILCCMVLTKKLYIEKGKKDFKKFLLDRIDQCILDIKKREELLGKMKHDKILGFISI